MSTAPIFKSYDDIQADKSKATYAQACEAGIAEILRDREFATIVPSMASKRAIIDFCQRYSGMAGTVPSLFLMKEAKKHNYAAFQSALSGCMKPITEQRAEIIFEIVVLLASGGTMTEADMVNEKTRLNNGWTLDKLRAERDRVINLYRLQGIGRKRGVDGLKAERAEMRGDNTPQVVAILPASYTAQELKRLAARDLPAFKKLVRDFGEQITTRLLGK